MDAKKNRGTNGERGRRERRQDEPRRDEPRQREPRSSQGMRGATGRNRDEWFALLDAWGASRREYRGIAGWLVAEHGLSNWWAQKLTVEYEQARGMRAAGVRRDGTFTVTASKTVAVPVARLYEAFVDPELRERWLPDAALRERASRQAQSVQFDSDDHGGTRVNAGFTAQGDAKSQVGLEHERLPDAKARDEARAYWRERLAALKTLLEG